MPDYRIILICLFIASLMAILGINLTKKSRKYPFPSISEHNGLYNISEDDDWGCDPGEEIEQRNVFCNQKNLPKLSVREIETIQNEITLLFKEHLIAHGVDPKDVQRECEGIATSVPVLDRTIRIELDDRSILNREFVLKIQNRVLKTNPLWRIFFLGEEESTGILIYPEVVRPGGLPVHGDWVKGIKELNKEDLTFQRGRTQELDNQLAFMASRISSMLPKITNEKPFEIAGVFSGKMPFFDRVTESPSIMPTKCIWLLKKSSEKERISLIAIEEKEWPGVSQPIFGVTFKGEIKKAKDEDEANKFPFVLEKFWMPQSFDKRLFVVEFDDYIYQSRIKRKWPFNES